MSFILYTTAMIGVIFLALFVFKTFSNKCFTKKSSMLNIEDQMSLSPRKTLYVIKAQNERYLIAADVDRTSLIAKLGSKGEKEMLPVREDKSSELGSFDGIESINDFASILDFPREKTNKGPMMKELARKLRREA